MTKPTAPTFMERSGATPGKLVLIGVLAIVLAYVILSQIPWGNSSATQPPASSQDAGKSTTAGVPPKSSAPTPLATSNPWPTVELTAVVAHDPFAPPLWTGISRPSSDSPNVPKVQANAETANSAIDRLVTSGAAVVVIVDGERLALVGDRQIRVGDRLEGFMVTAITEEGVVLSGEGETE